MIGQRIPTSDEPVCCITAIFTPPGFGCKGLFSRVFGLPPPAICTTSPDTRPRVGEVSQKRCDSSTPNRLSSLATATGDCARGRTSPRFHPRPRGPPRRRVRPPRHRRNCRNLHARSTRTGLRPRFPDTILFLQAALRPPPGVLLANQ